MPPIKDISPVLLKERHRLSPQQINSLFGSGVISETIDEKANAIGKVGEFLRITDALSAASIRFIPLKGPLLSFRLYGDATLRYFSDLDILVDASSLTCITKILEGEGYVPYGRLWPLDYREQRRVLSYAHHISFFHPEKLTAFEIHWRLATRPWLNFSKADTFDAPELTSLSFEGRSFTVLNNEQELLFLVIHGGHHRWSMLKWLVDVNVYLKVHYICWEKFSKLSDALNAGRMVALCNAMLSEYFPGGTLMPCLSPAPEYMVRLSKKAIEDASTSGPETVGEILTIIRFLLHAYPGSGHKFRVLKNTVTNSFFHGRLSSLFR
jgi:Uncharacterised nucleotidyltransferase